MPYHIELTEDAKADFEFFEKYERQMILQGIREQLQHEPCVETRNRKLLRNNPVASWELRLGKYRVFYDVEHDIVTVTVIAIGHKTHNALFIRGRRFEL